MACFFHSPTIVGWMPCLVANWAVVSSPRSASSVTFALNSAEYRFRLLVIQVRPSQERTKLKPLPEFAVPPHRRMITASLRATATFCLAETLPFGQLYPPGLQRRPFPVIRQQGIRDLI